MDANARNAIHWFEIPVRDMDRAQRFYEAIFGISMQRTEMDGYLMAMFPGQQDGASGCLAHGEGCAPSTEGCVLYLNAEPQLDAVLARIEGAGGKILIGRTEISGGHGFFAHVLDTEGNRVGLHAMQ
ncbi:MAG TPA: VOC family protein [Burkholderiaceae bacterium]|nr:VOC family protein [Burkholderiaceae bacterium]